MNFERAHTFSPLQYVFCSSTVYIFAIMLDAVNKVWSALKCLCVLEDFY